jgi:hypothetical protein
MRKFIAVITDKKGDVKNTIPVYADDATHLEHVTSAYEQLSGYKVGHANRFGLILKEVMEVDYLDLIVICDSHELY